MSRLVYQTATLLEKHDSSWFDYILSLLGPYCAKGWDRQENIDTRDNTTSIRMILSTLTYACFYKLHLLFFPEGSGSRVFTKEMFNEFNEISLAALIMSSGYILDYGVTGVHYNYVFSSRFNARVDWWKSGLALHLPYHCTSEELNLLQNRLSELGIDSVIALSRVRRMRAGPRILIPFEEFSKLKKVVGQYIIENKKYLIENK